VYEVCQHVTINQRNNFKPQHLTRPAKYVSHNTEARSCNRCCSAKSVSIAYSEYVFVDLGIQHAICLRHIACPDLQYFSTLSQKTVRFSNKKINGNETSILIFYDFCFKRFSCEQELSEK